MFRNFSGDNFTIELRPNDVPIIYGELDPIVLKPWHLCGKINTLNIEDIKVIVPNKVVEITFVDGIKEKVVCKETDTFSLENAITICLAKKILGGSSKYNNFIRKTVKDYNKKIEQEKKDKVLAEQIAKKKAKNLEKKKARLERKAQKEKEKQIEIQKEAYIQAMKEINKNGDN
jgi:uncharacterized membrane protein YcgQ (UPF0703/DUF1980 family)